jgi:hypothetical protein
VLIDVPYRRALVGSARLRSTFTRLMFSRWIVAALPAVDDQIGWDGDGSYLASVVKPGRDRQDESRRRSERHRTGRHSGRSCSRQEHCNVLGSQCPWCRLCRHRRSTDARNRWTGRHRRRPSTTSSVQGS